MRATPADRIHPGLNLTKTRNSQHRQAQISAVTDSHAIIYWFDTDQQTSVKLERFNRTTEWKLATQ